MASYAPLGLDPAPLAPAVAPTVCRSTGGELWQSCAYLARVRVHRIPGLHGLEVQGPVPVISVISVISVRASPPTGPPEHLPDEPHGHQRLSHVRVRPPHLYARRCPPEMDEAGQELPDHIPGHASVFFFREFSVLRRQRTRLVHPPRRRSRRRNVGERGRSTFNNARWPRIQNSNNDRSSTATGTSSGRAWRTWTGGACVAARASWAATMGRRRI